MKKPLLSLAFLVWVVTLIFTVNAFAEGGAASKSDATTQAVISGTCKAMKRISYASNDAVAVDTTTSIVMVSVPGTSVSFTIPGTVATCVIVDYSAYTWASAGELMMVQAVLDGAPGFPGEVQFDGDSDENADGMWSRSHNHQWVFANVAPGFHTVNMEWRSFSGGTVWTHKRTMTVNHK
jgi:hypothetical protein